MESLESYRLNQPLGHSPKPPNTYFSKPKTTLSPQLSNSSVSSTNSTLKKQRPVSVTIGEYPTNTYRKQPGKFNFLQNGHDDLDGSIQTNQQITSQFVTELAQTLNRKKTESMVSEVVL